MNLILTSWFSTYFKWTVVKYYITLDHGSSTETNKATVEYYTGRGVVCFEGYKE